MERKRSRDLSVQQVLRTHAGRAPDAIAIAAPSRAPLSYARLSAQIDEIAGALRALGLGHGDRVALVMPDGPEMAVAFLAVSAIATAAPLNPSCRQHEFATAFSDLNVKMLLTSGPDDAPAVAAARKNGTRVARVIGTGDAPAGVFSLQGVSLERPATDCLPSSHDVALVLTTSGTTSRSKVVALSHANICASAFSIAASLDLRDDDRCLNVMPLFHVHGLIGGLLSSLAAGASVICAPGFDAPRFSDWLDELAPTWYTAVPTMHQAILARARDRRDTVARRPLRFIRSSSAALPEAVRTDLETTFKAPVIEAYGMTEASHQIASNPRPPGVRKAGSVGVVSGTEAVVIDEHGRVLETRQTGEIAIRGAGVITAYDSQAEAGEGAFVDGWLKTGDAGYVDDDGYLFITGRLKETINRGGEKINPREVDEVLLQHSGVAQAATFGAPHETLGQDVAAAVVLRAGNSCTDRELREFVGGRVAHFKVPARIFFLDSIPKSATGKLQRHRLAEQLNVRFGAPTSQAVKPVFLAPGTPLERALAAMWSDVLGVTRVGLHDSFFDLGGDSVLAARVLARLHAELGADLSFVTLFDRPTLGDMAQAVAAGAAAPAAPVAMESPAELRRPAIVALPREAFRVQRTAATDSALPTPSKAQPGPTDAERQRLLIEWNDTAVGYPGQTRLHELVEAQVDRTPRAIAVVCGREEISYEALNARANQLARLLRTRGVGPDVLVGVCLERSIEMMVSLLGILKAGGAYVPLDPSYPQDRLRFMLEDSAARVLVTEARLAERLRASRVEPVCLDTARLLLAAEGQDNLENVTTADNLAYVIFTSGSTGRPKGVMVSHGSVCNYMHWSQSAIPLTGDDRVLQRSSCGFDVSGWEFYAPLLAGARLIMAPPGSDMEPAKLVETIAAHRVTILQVVPSVLRQLIDEPGFPQCTSVRRVLCGGEALTCDLQERFFERLSASLYNLYGPTETCIYSASWMCQRGRRERVVPIGRPIANTQMYVLGTSLELVPIGAIGELYIGGVGLARGYINRPDLTAERFVRHPFSDAPNARLYRTGDLARYQSGGNLEFLGRVDHQMKIRGVRIEAEEIETVLRRHPAVREAVVGAREDVPGDRRLVAYLVPRRRPDVTNAALRQFLSETLPDPMVPNTFVWLDALPLSQSGKIDRQRLPAPPDGRPNLAAAFIPPRTAVEETMARIWSEVLRVNPIGIHDDFFDLGGHSLLATQIISRMNDTFGRRVSLRALFETPTIDRLAKVVEGAEGSEATPARAAIGQE